MDDRFGFPDRFDFPPDQQRSANAMTWVLLLIGLVSLLSGLYFLISRQGKDFADGFANVFGGMFEQNALQRDEALFRRAIKKGDYKAAIRAYDRLGQRLMQQRKLDVKTFHMNRADLQIRAKEPAAAAGDYSRVLAIEPGNALALNNRAYMRALARMEIDEALQDVEEALKLEGANASYIDTKAYLLYLKGRHREALTLLNQILDGPGRNDNEPGLDGWGEILFHRALVHRKLGDNDGFQRDMEEARRQGFRHDGIPEPLVNAAPPAAAPGKAGARG
jgi:tetratricopeptide (TPR) repeat protein